MKLISFIIFIFSLGEFFSGRVENAIYLLLLSAFLVMPSADSEKLDK